MSNPLVSVIMPAYNAEKWIAEAIDSILNQTYDNIELIVWDDGSTDGTWGILREYSSSNTRIYGTPKNSGVTYALNRLIEKSKGKYIARMDADDIAMPDRIEKQILFLENLSQLSAVGCVIELFGDENFNKEREKWWGDRHIGSQEIVKKLPYRNCICHPSVMFRGDVLREYMYQGGVFQDYDLFLRMASDGHLISKMADRVLLKYRVRSDSVAAVAESNWAEIKLKLRFLAKKFPRWNKFDTHVMRSIWQLIK